MENQTRRMTKLQTYNELTFQFFTYQAKKFFPTVVENKLKRQHSNFAISLISLFNFVFNIISLFNFLAFFPVSWCYPLVWKSRKMSIFLFSKRILTLKTLQKINFPDWTPYTELFCMILFLVFLQAIVRLFGHDSQHLFSHQLCCGSMYF